MRWFGPGIVIGHERSCKRVDQSSQCRCQGSWETTFDSQKRKSNSRGMIFTIPFVKQMNRHTSISVRLVCLVIPQYGGPSTSNDVPMTPIPVPDESMPDAIADEPDTSEIPVLPNSENAPVRNPRACWRSDGFGPSYATASFTTCCVFAKCACSHTIMVSQSPVKRRRCNNLLLLTLICNLSFHRQRPEQMMIPCHFLTLMIHHHGSSRNQKHHGYLPSKVHQ